MKSGFFVITTLLMLISTRSGADVTGAFLEPGVSYQVTNSDIDYPSRLSNSGAAANGFGVLGRGGFHIYERFFVAADARFQLLKFVDNANHISVDATAWNIGPVIGFQMADYGARLYAGYVLAGNLYPQSTNGQELTFENPNGWRLGAGLKLQHCSVNIEWEHLHYGSGKMTVTNAPTVSGINYSAEGLVASVSFPFEFN